MKRNWITRACLFVGLALLSNAAVAAIQDATILIDRAINSPTLTVKFSGVTVALVELRVNGVSVGTRSVGNLKSGETNFTLDLASLRDGDNEIEIRLFDKGGKLVGRERTLIATDDGTHSAVFLRAPKMGATVQGPVEIQIGFGRTMRNAYVSFFIDNQFKSMTNVQPFSYIWDTQREANGWHELEAWVVDDDSNTHKTRKIRVFVNNPGGRTFRNPAPVKPEPKTPLVLEPAANPGRTSAGGEKGLKSAVGAPGSLEPGVKHAAPRASGLTSANSLKSVTGSESGVKANPLQPGIAAGAKSLTPTGTRVASNKLAEPKASIVPTAKAAALTPVKKGAKLPNGPY
ncbi:MAG TPA: Ig-like domain-containing protein, partial [Fimbriimonadaceae bacterium]|nr:Ig-like domain-containing protein [Fimbriimonadaceae bacterium]